MTESKPADALKQHCLGPPAPSPAESLNTHRGWYSRGYLPHCDSAQLIQHIVFGLADAVPPNARPSSAIHGDHLLDDGHGQCLLRDGNCAEIVQAALLRDDGERYRLIAWCVMPNHVHAVLQQTDNVKLGDLIQSMKSTTAHRINHLLNRKGSVWRREYFDRFMRDDDHLGTTISYVEHNPVKTGLVTTAAEWEWSSARYRLDDAGEGAGGPRG